MTLFLGMAAISLIIVGYAAAEELALLPEGSAIAEMLADYSVMRDQARACETSQ